MSQVKRYLYRMLKYSPCKIPSIWILDLLYSLLIILTPKYIGLAIDGLASGEYEGFVFLLIIMFSEGILGFLYRRLDTRVYEKITIHFKEEYFLKATSQNINTAEIDANIELVEHFSEFLRMFIINLSGVLGILFPLHYLYINTETKVLMIATLITVMIICLQFYFSNSKQKEVNHTKDENEKRWNIIGQRNISTYRSYLNRIMGFNIRYSDKDALSYILSTTLQLSLLAFAVFHVVSSSKITAGIIFATVTYIIELNEKSFELPEIYENYLNLKDDISRIDI